MACRSLLFVLACLTALAGVVGCKPQDAVYETDRNLGSDNNPLLPNNLSLVYDDGLLKGRAKTPDLSHLVPAPKPSTTASDDEFGEIKNLIATRNELVKAKKYTDAIELSIPELRETTKLNYELHDRLGRLLELLGGQGQATMMVRMIYDAESSLQFVSATRQDDETVMGSLKADLPGMPPIPTPASFKLVDGQWLFGARPGVNESNIDQIDKIYTDTINQLDIIITGLADESMDTTTATGQLMTIFSQMQKMQIMSGTGYPQGAAPPAAPESEPPENESTDEKEP